MKSLLLVWLGLMPLLVDGQAMSSTRIDSLNKQQLVLGKRLDSLSVRMQHLFKTNDSLNKELYYYRVKDDFYVMAVDRQGSHFEWFVGIVLTIAGLINYQFFQKEINRARREAIAQITETKSANAKLESEYKRLKYRSHAHFAMMLFNGGVSELNDKSTFSQLTSGLGQFLAGLQNALEAQSMDVDDTAQIGSMNKKSLKNFIKNCLHNSGVALSRIENKLDTEEDEEMKKGYLVSFRENFNQVNHALNMFPADDSEENFDAVKIKERIIKIKARQ